MRRAFTIRLRDGFLRTGSQTRVMGIVNVTPDSFFDGARYDGTRDVVNHAVDLIDQGADIIDIGGESTRPGSTPVDTEEEIRRVLPVIERLCRENIGPISIDTQKAEVAARALEAGAHVVNDVSGLRFDSALASVVRRYDAAIILSHMRGRPEFMHTMAPAADIVREVVEDLKWSVACAVDAGLQREQIIVDPGLGFGKTAEQNLVLIHRLDALAALGFPILVGPSRKSFIGKVLNQASPDDRLLGTAASVACAVMQGADIVRVHDVGAIRQVVDVVDAILNEEILRKDTEVRQVM